METIWKERDIVMLATEDKNAPITQLKSIVDIQFSPKHLYILSNEEIKEGDWFTDGKKAYHNKVQLDGYIGFKKIIATTDPKLLTTRISVDQDFNESYIPVPQIPQSFVELFVKEQRIDKVLVAYECQVKAINYGTEEEPHTVSGYDDWTTVGELSSFGLQGVTRREQLKLDNNEIKIKKVEKPSPIQAVQKADRHEHVKESWSREEVEELCRRLIHSSTDMVQEYGHCGYTTLIEDKFNKWIKDNL